MLGGQPLADGGTRDGWVEFGPKKKPPGKAALRCTTGCLASGGKPTGDRMPWRFWKCVGVQFCSARVFVGG